MARASHTSQSGAEGPISGSYISLPSVTLADVSIAYGATTTTRKITLPVAIRIDEVELRCVSTSGGASRPTVMITDGTNNLFSGEVSLVTADAVLVTPTSGQLVAAQRTRAKGDVLSVVLTTVASEAIVQFSCRIYGHVIGHIVAAAAND